MGEKVSSIHCVIGCQLIHHPRVNNMHRASHREIQLYIKYDSLRFPICAFHDFDGISYFYSGASNSGTQ